MRSIWLQNSSRCQSSLSRAMLRWWACLTVNPSLVVRYCCTCRRRGQMLGLWLHVWLAMVELVLLVRCIHNSQLVAFDFVCPQPCCVYVSEDQPRRSLGSVSSMVQGGDGVFNQVLPKHRRNSSPASRHRCDDDAFFSQAKTQVSQTWIYKSVEFINCINFPCAAGSRILETSTGCVVVINSTIWVFMSKKISYDSPLLSEYSCLDMVVYSLPTFVEVYWSAGGTRDACPVMKVE